MSPDPMVPVKVGVIGIGNMGWHHARVLSLLRDADLVGVADPDAERGKLATEQFGCRWFAVRLATTTFSKPNVALT